MEPRIVEKDAFLLMGVLTIGSPDKLDYADIWENKYMPFDARIKPHSMDGAYYGAWIGDEGGGLPGYLAGMAVDPLAAAPEGCVLHPVPAAKYAVFDCSIKNIGSTYQFVWQEWMPASSYVYDAGKSDFEYYPAAEEGQEMVVSIWIPVKQKEAVAS